MTQHIKRQTDEFSGTCRAHREPWDRDSSTNNAASPDQTINFIHNVSELVVSICGGQFELQDESVNLVDAHSHCQPLLHSMLDQPLCVQHHLQGTASSEPQERPPKCDLRHEGQPVTLTLLPGCRKAQAQQQLILLNFTNRC